MNNALGLNAIHEGDCLTLMERIEDASVDMILCDLPYGTTQNKWDSIIPLDKLWTEYERIIKDNGAIVLTGQGAFTASLITSARVPYRYSLVWEKTRPGGFLNARRMPLQAHEDIALFYKKLPQYNPQGLTEVSIKSGRKKKQGNGNYNGGLSSDYVAKEGNFPRSVLKFANDNHETQHPTQKPVALFEYLIKTYTNEGNVVLDNCLGSGTTAVATINTNRSFIGIEREPEYVAIAQCRIDEALAENNNE